MKDELESRINKLESEIIVKHLSVGRAESEVDGLQAELEEAESILDEELKELEEMETELTDLQEQLESINENGEESSLYSFGAGQIQEETLFDNFEEYEQGVIS